MDVLIDLYLPLAIAAMLAGLVDAVVGGGGLIQVPALFAVLPQAAPATLLGTNKLAGICGTAMAARSYWRRYPIDWVWWRRRRLQPWSVHLPVPGRLQFFRRHCYESYCPLFCCSSPSMFSDARSLARFIHRLYPAIARWPWHWVSVESSVRTTASSAQAPAASWSFCLFICLAMIFYVHRPPPR